MSNIAKGFVELVLLGPDGEIKQIECAKNLVVNGGLAEIALGIRTSPSAKWCGMGTGTTAVSASQTALVTEISTRTTPTGATLVTTTTTNDTTNFPFSFPAGTATGALTEAGIFSASTVGTMFARVVFPVINKAAADTLLLTWKVQMQP